MYYQLEKVQCHSLQKSKFLSHYDYNFWGLHFYSDLQSNYTTYIVYFVLSGVVPYVISAVIKNLVGAKILKHNEITLLMRAFEYGPNDAKNKPVALRNVNQFNYYFFINSLYLKILVNDPFSMVIYVAFSAAFSNFLSSSSSVFILPI